MVDILALALSHGLLAVAILRLVLRGDLDREGGGESPRGQRGVPRRMIVPGAVKAENETGTDA